MPEELIRFEDFELSRGAFELRRKGRPVRLERIPLELLFLLVERRGLLVGREEILEHVWGKDVFVDTDNSINTAVRKSGRRWGMTRRIRDSCKPFRAGLPVRSKDHRCGTYISYASGYSHAESRNPGF